MLRGRTRRLGNTALLSVANVSYLPSVDHAFAGKAIMLSLFKEDSRRGHSLSQDTCEWIQIQCGQGFRAPISVSTPTSFTWSHYRREPPPQTKRNHLHSRNPLNPTDAQVGLVLWTMIHGERKRKVDGIHRRASSSVRSGAFRHIGRNNQRERDPINPILVPPSYRMTWL